MHVVQLAKIGMVSESAKVLELAKRIGEPIAIGDHLMTVETEKAAVEVQSSGEGTVARYLVEPGAEIVPGTALAVILAAGESLDEAILSTTLVTADAAPQASPAEPVAGSTEIPAAVPHDAPVRATPRVRKRASELGVDLAAVRPSGPGGVITEQDVENAARSPAATAGEPLSRAARAVARHMAQSWREIPHFHQIIELDAEPLFETRRALGVSLTPLLVKAAALGLKRHPHINAHFDGERLIRLETIDIAVAVGDDDSLLTPVIQAADCREVRDLASELERLTLRAREGQLTPEQAFGGGFTVSNLGMYGIETGTPIINAPQVALMFVGAAVARPVIRAGQLLERRFLKVTLSYDHRALSGVRAARFSQEIRGLLQEPATWAARA